MILVYDMLLGKGIQCGGPLKYFIMGYKEELKALSPNKFSKSTARKYRYIDFY